MASSPFLTVLGYFYSPWVWTFVACASVNILFFQTLTVTVHEALLQPSKTSLAYNSKLIHSLSLTRS